MKLIWAEDSAGGIGADNKLLWHIPEDLARFKSLTSGGTVIMGRKTWESLPLRPLPSRQNVVISRQAEVVEAETVRSVEEALSRFPDSWVIGGSEIYDLFLPHAEMIYRTVVGKVYGEADAFAPKGWEAEFRLTETEPLLLADSTEILFERWDRSR